MPPPLPTHLGEHKRFSELNWTRPVLLSTPWGCSENQRRGKEGRVFRRNVTSPGPLPTAQSQPTQATTGHVPAWPANSTGLRARFPAPLQSLSVNTCKIFQTYIFTQLQSQFSYSFLLMIRGSVLLFLLPPSTTFYRQ